MHTPLVKPPPTFGHSVRNNYKRCGHYVDLVRLFSSLSPSDLTTYFQPDEMVRPSTAYLSEDLNSVGTTALRFNVTIVTASSAPRIPGTVFHPAARRLVGSSASDAARALHQLILFSASLTFQPSIPPTV